MSNISLLPATTPAELTAIHAAARGTFRRRIARRIIVALAAAFSFAAPAGACSLVCLTTPYTLTGAADTPAARGAACNAAKAGFNPPLPGMLESLPGNTALFAGAKGGVACADIVLAPAAAGHSAININKTSFATSMQTCSFYFFEYGIAFNSCIDNTAYASPNYTTIATAYKAAFLTAYPGTGGNVVAEAAAAAYISKLKTTTAPYAGCWSDSTCPAAAESIITAMGNSSEPAAAAETACNNVIGSAARLVCCNM